MNMKNKEIREKVDEIRSWIGQLALVGSDLVVERKINSLCNDIDNLTKNDEGE